MARYLAKEGKKRKICILALKVSKISAFIRTDRRTDIARSTKLVILIKNIGIYFIRSLQLLHTYFPKYLLPYKLQI